MSLFEFTRQEYEDVEGPTEAIKLGYDVFQLKYDGIWARCEIEDHVCTIYSRTNNVKGTFLTDLPNCCLVGEFMFGTEWANKAERAGNIYVFDIIGYRSENFAQQPYHERLRHLIDFSVMFGATPFKLAATCRIDAAQSVWDRIVSGEADYEGLVYRKLNDPYSGKLARSKREITDDVVIMDKYEGQGRLAGTLGGLIVGKFDANGILQPLYKVGGGFSDTLRAQIWTNWPSYYLSVAECVGKARFESGALRHPNFKRFRADKKPNECLINET